MYNIKNILQDLKEEIEATTDSNCVSNIRFVERRRLLRCVISLRCIETAHDRSIQPSVDVKVPLEFTVNEEGTFITMLIPRNPTIVGTYWFNGDKVILAQKCKELELTTEGTIKDQFEFNIDMFKTDRADPKYFQTHFSISN